MTRSTEPPKQWRDLSLLYGPDPLLPAEDEMSTGEMTLTPDFVAIDSPFTNVFRVGCGLSIIPSTGILIFWTWTLFAMPRTGPVFLVNLLLWAIGEVMPLVLIWIGYMAFIGMIQERRAARGETPPALHVGRNVIRLGDTTEVRYQHQVKAGASFRVQIRLVCVNYVRQYASGRTGLIPRLVWESETVVFDCPVQNRMISLRGAFTFSRSGRATQFPVRTPDYLAESFSWFWQIREDREGQAERYYAFVPAVLPFRTGFSGPPPASAEVPVT